MLGAAAVKLALEEMEQRRAVLALTGDYIRPYASPVGQVLLALLLGLYVATLVWMRRMSTGKPLPRFIGSAAKATAR